MNDRAAVLIVAHQHPELVRDLVRSLDHEAIDVYLHIDAATSLLPFEQALRESRSITFLRGSDRVTVRWGGLSIVRAVQSLVRTARASGRDYHRFVLLSGSDILIKPLDDIFDAWSSTTEFLRIDRKLTGPDAQRPHFVDRRHFQDSNFPLRHRISGRIPRSVDSTIDLYHGSTWWALTEPATAYVTTFLDNHPRWVRFHRHTLCADEIVFHSVLKASPFAAAISQDRTVDSVDENVHENIHGMHFIDWADPTAVSPKLLGTSDIDRLSSSAAYFARKVDPASSLHSAFAVNPR
ncbi:hypothetical protein ABH922_001527 [Rhodococcus sp. 27YEA15]|uniref:beta-1,6-N-acetylglucosaminyltransferase n=1 Tax=Rhodococcus sp. 27YEA15 TaxID=3156259 RepID=UPI003C7E55F9